MSNIVSMLPVDCDLLLQLVHGPVRDVLEAVLEPVANYNFRRSENMDTVTRTCISYDEIAYILDDVPSRLWEQVSTELLTLRLQLEERRWGGRKEITSTKKFRGK